jgi:hypothetical protein
MKRRTVLGLFASVGLSTSIVGSGAFSYVRADRNVSIQVVDDELAYLELDPTEVYGRSGSIQYDGDPDGPSQVDFEIPGRGEPSSAGDGVGLDSKYFFDGLLDVTNSGTNGVKLTTEFDDTSDTIVDLDLFYVDDDEEQRLRANPVSIDVGESVRVGLYIETGDGDLGEFNSTLTIVAKK